MTAKEYLSQGRQIERRINYQLKEATYQRKMAESISSASLEMHYDPNGRTETPFIRSLERAWKAEQKADAEIDRLYDLREQMAAVISTVPDDNERLVLNHRYLHNMSWEEIGEALNIDRTTVYRRHNRALAHVFLPENPIKI